MLTTAGIKHTKIEVWDDEGKTAIVTGGDSGIGRAAAIMFAREGCIGITISHLPEEHDDAQAAKKQMEEAGAQVNVVPCDLMKDKDCQNLVESHMCKFGKLNIIVNNASKQLFCPKLEEIDLGQVESTFRSNIFQMFAVTKFALPYMKRGASIINTTSVTAYRGSPALVDYSATKGAITSFARSLAVQLAPKGIRVNAIASGPVVTVLQAGSRKAEDMDTFGVGEPLHGRAGQPAEVGPAYVFLASSDSNIMTGQVLHINSGEHIGAS